MKKKILAFALGVAVLGGSSIAAFASSETKTDTNTNTNPCCIQKAPCCIDKAPCCK